MASAKSPAATRRRTPPEPSEATSTTERLQELVKRKVFSRETAEHLQAAFQAFTYLRLRREIELLEGYLPAEIDDDVLREAIAEIVAAENLSGPGAMGPLMKQMMARFAGRADGGRINRLVREALTG